MWWHAFHDIRNCTPTEKQDTRYVLCARARALLWVRTTEKRSLAQCRGNNARLFPVQNSFPLYLPYLPSSFISSTLYNPSTTFLTSPFCIATSSYSPLVIARLTSALWYLSHPANKMKAYPCSTVDEIDSRDEITIDGVDATPFWTERFRRQIRLRRQDFRQNSELPEKRGMWNDTVVNSQIIALFVAPVAPTSVDCTFGNNYLITRLKSIENNEIIYVFFVCSLA